MDLRSASIASNGAIPCFGSSILIRCCAFPCVKRVGVEFGARLGANECISNHFRFGNTVCNRNNMNIEHRGNVSLLTLSRVAKQAAHTGESAVIEVTQETFWPVMEAAGDKLVVLNLYTQSCGPCEIMYPKIVDLSQMYTDVLFLKLDCNQNNRALSKKMGVKVVPTFKLFRNRKELAEVKGAKFDELVRRIQEARAAES
ncbi:hypothetical protein KP509_01G084000 [Ceratopteris richardii]|uniref:Thioredoxin domain-containing protein n=1 Tax=Ceratopteris richardii TaxID=49495 RepID=A0A8T2VN27_CERRI|nr:hypothetical protein KP509_01G084000 [Ceratopteris richardii]